MAADLSSIRSAFEDGAYNISVHGFFEMGNDYITTAAFDQAIVFDMPEVIEDYPNDPKGASCLILAWVGLDSPIHACIGYAGSQPLIITVYRPNLKPEAWSEDFRTRR